MYLPPHPYSEKYQLFLPQQSYNGKYLSRGGGGRARANFTKIWIFFCLTTSLNFIFSPSLQDHSSHFPWGTSIISNLSGTCRSLSQVPPHLGEFFRTFGEKEKKAKDAQDLRVRVDLNSLKSFCPFEPQLQAKQELEAWRGQCWGRSQLLSQPPEKCHIVPGSGGEQAKPDPREALQDRAWTWRSHRPRNGLGGK